MRIQVTNLVTWCSKLIIIMHRVNGARTVPWLKKMNKLIQKKCKKKLVAWATAFVFICPVQVC